MIEIGANIDYECSNGGIITIYVPSDVDVQTGMTADGYAYYDDLYINAHDDMTLNLAHHNVSASVQHLTGEKIIEFDITSRVPNGRADIMAKNLKPDAWYRLTFESVLATTDGGFAHGNAGANGEIGWIGVRIPNG